MPSLNIAKKLFFCYPMFMNSLITFIGTEVRVVIDRPLGSTHPKYGFSYPAHYGYVLGTLAPDGEAIDAYVLGVDAPLKEFAGRCIAIIHRTDDDDDKLIVVPETAAEMTDDDIRAATMFQEKFFSSHIIRKRA